MSYKRRRGREGERRENKRVGAHEMAPDSSGFMYTIERESVCCLLRSRNREIRKRKREMEKENKRKDFLPTFLPLEELTTLCGGIRPLSPSTTELCVALTPPGGTGGAWGGSAGRSIFHLRVNWSQHVYVKNEGKREKHLWNTPIHLD